VHILYVEDDPSLGFVVQDRLKAEGFIVHLMRDGKSALQQFNSRDYDCCVLDVMLPQKDGFSLAEDIRKVDSEIPILFLTARESIDDKATGFNKGGDDYLTKPFEHRELVMRIQALLKRHRRQPEQSTRTIGNYRYDERTMTLGHGDDLRRLTKTENKVLSVLHAHRDQVLERELLLNLVWGKDDYQTGRSLDVYVSKLRKYLSQDPRIRIENVHGVGFKLEVDGD
ncbi:MAG: response regulator transcription factor, partial [Flavobacteriales bacterium]|nr:response regulator transcription factor [Flavobacteriales bacterium]